ncbi:hypothetical protein QU972_26455 [Escherichia coli]|nr:hypothetical protein [Escherichia coli]
MEEQANKILVELLRKASNGIDAAVSFSQAQIPDVIHQLLMWHAVSSAGIQAICVLVIIACVYLMIFAWNKGDDADIVLLSLLVTSGIAITSIVVFFNYFDWLKIWLAPKLYLIEYAASLVK